jgi:hypothetical protein
MEQARWHGFSKLLLTMPLSNALLFIVESCIQRGG